MAASAIACISSFSQSYSFVCTPQPQSMSTARKILRVLVILTFLA